MRPLLCPSMMCADYNSLQTEVRRLNETEADIFHVDVMDGSFVPNYAMGLEDLKCIRKNTGKKVDVHLMVDHPETAVEVFGNAGADIIYVHPETDRHIARTLTRIRNMGIAPGIAINPGTSIESVIELLPLVDYILVMTVNPGFAGQKYLDFVNGKIRTWRSSRMNTASSSWRTAPFPRKRSRSCRKWAWTGLCWGLPRCSARRRPTAPLSTA